MHFIIGIYYNKLIEMSSMCGYKDYQMNALLNLGIVYMLQKKIKAAINTFEACLKIYCSLDEVASLKIWIDRI